MRVDGGDEGPFMHGSYHHSTLSYQLDLTRSLPVCMLISHVSLKYHINPLG